MILPLYIPYCYTQNSECLLEMYINPNSISPDFCVTLLDSPPRMSRMDRNSRSVSQPRGKRDSSVSSAYGGGIFFVNIKLNRHLEIKAMSRISLSSHKRARLELGLFLLTISKLYYFANMNEILLRTIQYL